MTEHAVIGKSSRAGSCDSGPFSEAFYYFPAQPKVFHSYMKIGHC